MERKDEKTGKRFRLSFVTSFNKPHVAASGIYMFVEVEKPSRRLSRQPLTDFLNDKCDAFRLQLLTLSFVISCSYNKLPAIRSKINKNENNIHDRYKIIIIINPRRHRRK